MKKGKRLAALGLAGALVLSAAGCGNSGQDGQSHEVGTTTDNAGAATAAGTTEASVSGQEPVTIKITWWGGQGRHDYTQKLLDKYTELNPHVTFEAIPSGWDGYFDKLATQAAAGAMPDIIQMDYLYITTYAKNGSIADLQPYIDSGILDVANVDENLLNAGRIDGKLSGAVLSSSYISVAYNPEVLVEAGVEEPGNDWTWEDYQTINQAIKDKTGKMGCVSGVVDDTNIYQYWVRQHGENLFSEDKKSLGYEDDSICVEFLDYWKALQDNGLSPNPDEYAALQALGQEGSPMVTGESAMKFGWNNQAATLSTVNDKLKVVTPPLNSQETGQGLWLKPGMFFSVSETSKLKEEAAAFINWFINSEEANDIIMAERGVPVSSVIREYMSASGNLSPQQTEMFGAVADALLLCGETPAPDPIGMSEINEAFKNAAFSVFYGQSTSEEAAAAFRTEANGILARNN